ncbi:acyl-CoA thioesterase [Halosquirtibacter xylanolyticus]|uniref:acyl-CoA thioesterase n=1 Tax=Halosquirtibacter xylanolyticus TaxID=3374599 RepID=UPI0037482BC4|nr:acyl-CoA thioesterase [Prolixibacteraceae bacterium]
MKYRSVNYRVCFADTDAMGIVYYANYLHFFEMGRNAFIRDVFKSYKEIEESGVQMPVASVEVKYRRPAQYDELLEVRTSVKSLSQVKMSVYTEVYNQENILLCSGTTVLAFLDKVTHRPRRVPKDMMLALNEYLSEPELV